MQKDLYTLLNIDPTATRHEIRVAFRRLAKRYHPDLNKGDPQSAELFKEIHAAYRILSDKVQRKAYDEQRAQNRNQTEPKPQKAKAAKEPRARSEPVEEPSHRFASVWRDFLAWLDGLLRGPPAKSSVSSKKTQADTDPEPKAKGASFAQALSEARNKSSPYVMCEDGIIRKQDSVRRSKYKPKQTWVSNPCGIPSARFGIFLLFVLCQEMIYRFLDRGG